MKIYLACVNQKTSFQTFNQKPLPAMQFLLTNFIGVFSKMSEVSGLTSATPSVGISTHVEVTNCRPTKIDLL